MDTPEAQIRMPLVERGFSLPDRTVQLNHVSIRPAKHDLAIISSVRSGSAQDLLRYAKQIKHSFGGKPVNTQVIFADNTPDFAHKMTLEEVGATLSQAGIDFNFIHVPQPGKINGLNGCLMNAEASYVLSVDTNKTPAPNTLMGLYQTIRDTNLDLVSAQVSRGPQHWCAGQAYIGKRDFFRGFPGVLNEDEYTLLVTMARGGKFMVADKLTVYDVKGANLTTAQKNERRARQVAASYQLRHLIVVDEQGNEMPLRDQQDKLQEESLTHKEKLARLLLFTLHMPLTDLVRLPLQTLMRAAAQYENEPGYDEALLSYIEKLRKNPDLCAWTV